MAHSHIEEGTQESVATIGAYAIWGIGLLFGLGALGVNSASLAVVKFGVQWVSHWVLDYRIFLIILSVGRFRCLNDRFR